MVALVVDDSAAMRRAQQKILEGLGWQVYVASGGEQALSMLAGLPDCDLLVTDWHMPGMDGIALIHAVRSDLRHRNLRILMVTSDSVLSTVQQALAAGANDVLMKPYTREAMAERLLEVMGG